MQLRWTEEAAADLERIAEYLHEHVPAHASRLVRTIYDAPSVLDRFPLRGRVGKREGTRELVLPSLPYILIYVVGSDTIHVVRILHGAQRWP